MNKELIKAAYRLGYQVELEKHAGLGKLLASGLRTTRRSEQGQLVEALLRRMKGAGSRYIELLRGGDPKIVGTYNRTVKNLKNRIRVNKRRGEAQRRILGFVPDRYEIEALNDETTLRKIREGARLGHPIYTTRSGLFGGEPLGEELSNVRFARRATALGAGGAAAYGLSKNKDEEE